MGMLYDLLGDIVDLSLYVIFSVQNTREDQGMDLTGYLRAGDIIV